MYTIEFDTAFYEALRRGDEAAFTTAFHRFNRMLYALAYRYLKSEPLDQLAKPAVHHPQELFAERVAAPADCH